jgi:hypothetical protein
VDAEESEGSQNRQTVKGGHESLELGTKNHCAVETSSSSLDWIRVGGVARSFPVGRCHVVKEKGWSVEISARIHS